MAIIKKKVKKQEEEAYTNIFYNYRDSIIYLKKESTSKYIQKKFYPSFFIDAVNKDKLIQKMFDGKLIKLEKDGEKYIRCYYDSTIKRDDLMSTLKTHEELRNVPIYEGDVDPVRRYIIDNNIKISTKFKALFLDIETHCLLKGFSDEAKKQHRIISFAGIDYQTKKKYYHACSKSSDKEEYVLLDKMMNLIKQYDVVLAWNGDNYDFFVIKERMKYHRKRFDWRTVHFLDQMQMVKKLLSSVSDVDFKRSFALDNVGENILGIRKLKLPVGYDKLHTLLTDDPEILKEYNIHDCVIMDELEKKKGFLDLWFSLCSLTLSLPNHRSIYPSYRTDGMLLKIASKEGLRFPTFYRSDDYTTNYKKYEGAYVMDPIVGFHTDVQVPDFASLYPSIMISWNMSYETIIKEGDIYDGPYCKCTASGCDFKTDKQGIIPKALDILIDERNIYKKKTKEFEVGSPQYKNMDNLSTAVKVTANSIYGLLGNEGNRYYNRDIARSITLTGQFLAKQLKQYYNGKGIQVLYGDTDSSFIKCTPEQMKESIIDLNDNVYPKLLKQFNCYVCRIKLDYDKGFKSLLMLAKKNYAGKLSIHKGRLATENTPLEIKGLEIARSDKIRYVQKIQREFLDLILQEDCDAQMINELVISTGEDFFNRKFKVDEIEISKSLSKPIEEYTTRVLAVEIAKNMQEKGIEVFTGMKIPHIITSSNPVLQGIHSSEYDGTFDRQHYWKNMVLPPLERIIKPRFPNFYFDKFDAPTQLRLDFGGKVSKEVQKKTKSIKKLEGKNDKKKESP